MISTPELAEKVTQLRTMMKPDFDWDVYYEQDDAVHPDDLFREGVIIGFPEKGEAKQYVECGSAEVEDTPCALYRLLWLLEPKEKLDFSDMYKAHLISFFSADKRCLVSVHFYKHEIGLYFYALRGIVGGPGSGVLSGMPGANNGWHCTDEDARAFFAMVTKAVNRTWTVYNGNNFEV